MRFDLRVGTLAVLAGCAAWAIGCRREHGDTSGAAITARTLGLVYLQQNRLPEAEQQFETVAKLSPDQPLGWADLGLVHLRLERYDDARRELEKALSLDSTSVDARLTLVKVYEATGHPDRARQTLLGAHDSTDARILWALANVDTAATDNASRARRLDALRRLVAVRPSDVAVRLAYVRALAGAGQADSALQEMEELRRIPPEAPAELRAMYDPTIKALREGRLPDALALLSKFQELAETTQAYQAGLAQVKGPPGPAAGFPVLAFNPTFMLASAESRSQQSIRAALHYVDATEDAGVRCASRPGTPRTSAATSPVVAAGDYDGEGGDDLFIGGGAGESSCLLRNEGALYADVTQRAGITLPAGAGVAAAAFGDYDNDGRLDLLVIEANGTPHLFRNSDGRSFREVTSAARLGAVPGVRRALFVDLDHDGDLDLLLVGDGGTRVERNNGDGTFTDATAEFGLAGARGGRDAAYGDLDGDGRLDLVIVGDSGVALYHNTSVRHFEPMPANGGVDAAPGATAVAIGDYDNDGVLDLAFASADGTPRLYRGRGDGSFERDARSARALSGARLAALRAIDFVDADNDGRVDLVVGGTASGGRRGVLLLGNDGAGRFSERSSMLPARVPGITTLLPVDYGADGDVDLLVATADSGAVRLLRNDGGNASSYVRVQLTGLRTGSGKNNDFGIGARIDVRAGDLYQVKVATSRTTLFGLGPHLKADVVRIQWPNGVRQTTYIPGSDRDALEQEVLKGSCAFLYTWNGRHYEFLGDLMWRSALGMPLGIMGRDRTAWAPAAASKEYVSIPGEMLQPRDGRYDLQLTEELWETAYVDQLKLLAVDHPDSVKVLVNERFVPPTDTEPLRLYRLRGLHPPAGAWDGDGTDVLPLLRERDDRYVATFEPDRVQGVTKMHDLVLDLSNGPANGSTLLVLDGWIFPSDASINVDLSQSKALQVVAPSLDVRDANGRWRTAIADLGFPAGKRKVVIADLTGKFPTADRHVRIRTNMQIYWDQVLVGSAADDAPVRTTELKPISAQLRFRGFSRTFRKGGRYGPQWFAYDDVSVENPWMTISGPRTRFGDVLPLLGHSDDMYVVMGPGDATALQFDAEAAPPLPKGWRRDFLVYSDGWIKDSDLNTAYGTTVGPLPFHAMREYPYAAGEHYPTDAAHQRYLETYETRDVRRSPAGDRVAATPR